MHKYLAYIIEDDNDTANLYQFILELIGYQTEIITNGETALEKLIANCPDLILLDLLLPGAVSGADILKTVREESHFAATRVIVISGYYHLAQDLELEPDLVLLKPISISQLSKLIVRMHPAKDELLHDASHDTLTVLYNQPFLTNRLELAIARAERRSDFLFAVMVLEIEGLNKVLLNRGGEYTDRLLVTIAHCLNAILRKTDTLARIDENLFAILLEEITADEDVTVVARRIQASLYDKLKSSKLTTGLRFNFGIVASTERYNHSEDYITAAQEHLLSQKNA
jgi:diguanylate cyclase (GGDEF)-like protein